jgi:hypothetical protein
MWAAKILGIIFECDFKDSANRALEYIKSGGDVNYVEQKTGSKKICILQSDWVMVGDFIREGNDCTLTNANVIRGWGTTEGLEIAINGPTTSTILNPCGTVRFDYLSAIAVLDCSDKWI